MPAFAPALGSLLPEVALALDVADAARAAVVVGLCCPKLEGAFVVEATTKVEGTDSDVELMTAGSTVLETDVDFGAADVVSNVSCEVEDVVVSGRTVVVLVLSVWGAMVERAVPVHPLGVIVVYTVR